VTLLSQSIRFFPPNILFCNLYGRANGANSTTVSLCVCRMLVVAFSRCSAGVVSAVSWCVTVFVSVCVCLCMSVCLSVCLSVSLCVCVCLFFFLSLSVSAYLFAYVYVERQSSYSAGI